MLNPRKRITKREIKEDSLVTAYITAQRFFRQHNKQIRIGFIAFSAVLLITVLMIRSKTGAERQAAGRLGVVEFLYFAKDYERSIPELIQIAEIFSGTRPAGKAVFYLANAYYSTDDFLKAEVKFHEYINDYADDDLFKSSSIAGIAACYENNKNFSDAAKWFEMAYSNNNTLFEAPFYLKDAGRCYALAGQIDKGREMYKIMLDDYSEASVTQQIDYLLEKL